jgi:hypothetical protein
MPVVNQVSANKNMNNLKFTNESRIRESTQADFSSMQKTGVKHSSHYSAIGLPTNQRQANNSIFSFSGSDYINPNGRNGDFPYQSSGSLKPSSQAALRPIENEYSHFSQAVEYKKSRETLKQTKSRTDPAKKALKQNKENGAFAYTPKTDNFRRNNEKKNIVTTHPPNQLTGNYQNQATLYVPPVKTQLASVNH